MKVFFKHCTTFTIKGGVILTIKKLLCSFKLKMRVVKMENLQGIIFTKFKTTHLFCVP